MVQIRHVRCVLPLIEARINGLFLREFLLLYPMKNYTVRKQKTHLYLFDFISEYLCIAHSSCLICQSVFNIVFDE